MPLVLQSESDPAPAIALGREVGAHAAQFAAKHDLDATFAAEGYEAARESGYGIIAVPAELGGGGQGLSAVCRAQAELARGCASTALATAMHQHVVLTMAWRWARGDTEFEPILRRVVDERLMIALSGPLQVTPGSPEGHAVDGGFVLSGRRPLCSGSPGADLLMCAGRVRTTSGIVPIRLLVPLRAAGVEIADDWSAMGMRASGSNSVILHDAFVPDANAFPFPAQLQPEREGPSVEEASRGTEVGDGRLGGGGQTVGRSGAPDQLDGLSHRPRVPVPSIIFTAALHISLTVIAATYLGAATESCDEALRLLAPSPRADMPTSPRLAGLMVNEATMGWWVLEAMIRETDDDSVGSVAQMITTLLGKRQIILSAIRTAELAMELLGSMSYRTSATFERTLRDVRAGITHPLTPEETLDAIGKVLLDLPLQ
jgi:alkylation response protein AidB-like acyl-CoA dehydrogenase